MLRASGSVVETALILSALSFLFLQLLTNGFLLSFIQVTGIEFFDIGLNLGIDVFQLPVDFLLVEVVLLGVDRSELAGVQRHQCFPGQALAVELPYEGGFSDRKPAIVRKQGCRPFNSHSSSMFRWHSRARSREVRILFRYP